MDIKKQEKNKVTENFTTELEGADYEEQNRNAMLKLEEIIKNKEKEFDKELIQMQIPKKTQFYEEDNELREHIATYSNKAILLYHNGEEFKLSYIDYNDLKNLKKVNGNKIRKIQPLGIDLFQKKSVLIDVKKLIDDLA